MKPDHLAGGFEKTVLESDLLAPGADPGQLGEDALFVVGMEVLRPEVRFLQPVLYRVTQNPRRARAHESEGEKAGRRGPDHCMVNPFDQLPILLLDHLLPAEGEQLQIGDATTQLLPFF